MNQFDFKKFYSLIDKREQYARNWSIRINNLVVPLELISRLGLSLAVMYTAYRTLIGPVLLKTINNWRGLDGFLPRRVPDLLDLLENGHFLGDTQKVQGSGVDKPRTIIIRFISRWWRNLFLKNKRKYLPKPSHAECVKYRISYYFVTPDLTKLNFKYLMCLKHDSRVKSTWTQDGNFLFKLHSTFEKIWFVSDTLKSLDEILANSNLPARPQRQTPSTPRQQNPTPAPLSHTNVPVPSRLTTETIPISQTTPNTSTTAPLSHTNVPVPSSPTTETTPIPQKTPHTTTTAKAATLTPIVPAKEPTTAPVSSTPNVVQVPAIPVKHTTSPAKANTQIPTPVPSTTSPSSPANRPAHLAPAKPTPEYGVRPKTRAGLCRFAAGSRGNTPKRKSHNKNKRKFKSSLADLEAAFPTKPAEGNAAALPTVTDGVAVTKETLLLKKIQLPTDEDIANNSFQESFINFDACI